AARLLLLTESRSRLYWLVNAAYQLNWLACPDRLDGPRRYLSASERYALRVLPHYPSLYHHLPLVSKRQPARSQSAPDVMGAAAVSEFLSSLYSTLQGKNIVSLRNLKSCCDSMQMPPS